MSYGDLVDRLKQHGYRVALEAADEIERLQAEVALWKSRAEGIVTWSRPQAFRDQQRECKTDVSLDDESSGDAS